MNKMKRGKERDVTGSNMNEAINKYDERFLVK